MIQLLAKLTIRTNGLERNQELGLQELLRRGRRSPELRIHCREGTTHRGEYFVGVNFHLLERVICSDPILDMEHRKELRGFVNSSTHRLKILIQRTLSAASYEKILGKRPELAAAAELWISSHPTAMTSLLNPLPCSGCEEYRARYSAITRT